MTTPPSVVRRLLGRLARFVRGLLGAGDEPTVEERFERQHQRIASLERDLARIGPQVAALEARIEDVRHRLTTPSATPDEVEQAVGLVEEIRREHERMRARVTAAARFEERLEQLEDQMAASGRTS